MGWIIHELVFFEKMSEAKRAKKKLFERKALKTLITLMKQIRKRKNLKNFMPFITSYGIATKRFTPGKKRFLGV